MLTFKNNPKNGDSVHKTNLSGFTFHDRKGNESEIVTDAVFWIEMLLFLQHGIELSSLKVNGSGHGINTDKHGISGCKLFDFEPFTLTQKIRKVSKLVGYPEDAFSGHSLRHGFLVTIMEMLRRNGESAESSRNIAANIADWSCNGKSMTIYMNNSTCRVLDAGSIGRGGKVYDENLMDTVAYHATSWPHWEGPLTKPCDWETSQDQEDNILFNGTSLSSVWKVLSDGEDRIGHGSPAERIRNLIYHSINDYVKSSSYKRPTELSQPECEVANYSIDGMLTEIRNTASRVFKLKKHAKEVGSRPELVKLVRNKLEKFNHLKDMEAQGEKRITVTRKAWSIRETAELVIAVDSWKLTRLPSRVLLLPASIKLREQERDRRHIDIIEDGTSTMSKLT